MATAANQSKTTTRSRTKATRSPNYPCINLPTALVKAKAVFDSAGRHPTGREVLAKSWKLSHTSSTFRLVLAALRSFGLLDEVPGREEPLLKLSERALDILADYSEGHPKWRKAVQEAALKPKIHADLRSQYGDDLPGDDEVRRHLIRGCGFNDRTVGTFIQEYKSTLEYAKLSDTGVTEGWESGGAVDFGDTQEVTVGDFVQWTSQGVDQFSEPRRVVRLTDDGSYAFVEGSNTGLPIHQLSTVTAANSAQAAIPPPGMREDTFTLDEGKVVLRMPERLSPLSYEDLEDWLILVLRKVWRSIEETEGSVKKPARPTKLEREQ